MAWKLARTDGPLKSSGFKVLQHEAAVRACIKQLTGSLFLMSKASS